jgi:hypothetical protein
MKVSIRTAYRIVKKAEENCEPIYIPQYQEEGSEDWHDFPHPIKGLVSGANPVYFYVLSKAIDYLNLQKRLQDVVVHYEEVYGD